MKIFKNRGSIYIPKSKITRDKEQIVLLICLAVIVIITILFIVFFGVKYNFSVKEFVNPFTNVSVSKNENNLVTLPEVSGKSNYVLIETGKKSNTVRFVILLQVDMDTFAYKTTTIKGSTKIDGQKISDIYNLGGGANVKTALGQFLGTKIDNYIAVNDGEFADLIDSVATIHYTISNQIKKTVDGEDGFSIRIRDGEQNLSGEKVLNLMRYYIEVEKNLQSQNDFVLNSVQQLISGETIVKKEKIFKNIVNNTETDITVKDYTEAQNSLTVLADESTSMSVYGVISETKNNVVTENSLNSIKGYFA